MEQMVSYPDGEPGALADIPNVALTNRQAHKKELGEQSAGTVRPSEEL